MASSDYVLCNIFASNSLRNTIFVSTPMFLESRNPTIIQLMDPRTGAVLLL